MSHTKLAQTPNAGIVDPLQLRLHNTAVTPTGLITVLDYQLGSEGEKSLKGRSFCDTFVIAFEWTRNC